jgi:DNA-binding response OmpR family regulator
MKLVLIEDDKQLGESLVKYITNEGITVDWFQTLGAASQHQLAEDSIVLLDWMLPDGQGIDFLKKIRANGLNNPVLMLTARNELIDKVLGLESGANDYITKPFEPRELMARIRAHQRVFKTNLGANEDQAKQVVVGSLVIDKERRVVTFKAQEVTLTKMEFDLLVLLAEKPGRAYSRDEILNKVWGFENFPTTRTVDTHVLQLRNKFSDEMIETVRGIGYRFQKNFDQI